MYAEMLDCQMSLVDVLFDYQKYKINAEIVGCQMFLVDVLFDYYQY